MSQEIGFFDRIRTGELMNRLSEVRQMRSYVHALESIIC